MILTCAAGFEDLVRGDLREEYGVRSRVLAPGRLSVEGALELGAWGPMVDTVGLSIPQVADELPAAVQELELARLGVDLAGPVTFRVQDDDPVRRAATIAAVTEALGWVNSPGDWRVNLDPARGIAEVGPLAWAARYGTMRRQPATTPPVVAAGLLRLAKVKPGMRLLDPCAGVGTIPIIDAMTRPEGAGVSLDENAASCEDARANVADRDLADRVQVRRADATALDLPDLSVDRVVSDLPFGKRIGSHEHNQVLYPAILRSLERVLAADGRMVLMSDDKRVFTDAVQRTRGLKVVAERVVRYNNVTPTAYVVQRSRKPRR